MSFETVSVNISKLKEEMIRDVSMIRPEGGKELSQKAIDVFDKKYLENGKLDSIIERVVRELLDNSAIDVGMNVSKSKLGMELEDVANANAPAVGSALSKERRFMKFVRSGVPYCMGNNKN